MDGADHNDTQDGTAEGNPEKHFITMEPPEQEHRYTRTDSGSDIVAKPVIANTFRTAGRREHINSHRGERDARSTEWRTMEHTEHGKSRETACYQVAPEESSGKKIEDEQHHLARKTIHEETAKRTNKQCRHGIARQHQTDDLLIRAIGVGQIKRQQRREEHKSKIHQEIARPDLDVVTIP